MMINVQMSAEEFQEFMEYRKDKEQFKSEIKKVAGMPHAFAKILHNAVEQDPKRAGKYKIVDQEHMDDLMDMTLGYLDPPEEW